MSIQTIQSISAFFRPIEAQYAAEFRTFTNATNIITNKLLAHLGIFFFFALLLMDFARHRQGDLFGNALHEQLMATHLSLALFFIPYFWIKANAQQIQEGTFKFGGQLTLLNLAILTLSLLSMAVLAVIDRRTVSAFGIYFLICNLVFPLHHKERIVVSLFSFLVICIAICIAPHKDTAIIVTNLLEALGIAIPTFVFATARYNLRMKNFIDEKQLLAQKQLIEEERQHSERLLLNILPDSVAKELKQYGKVTPRSIAQSTVLFSDFKNFSTICATLSPEELIADLNEIFKNFDLILSSKNLQRIKTIGDAYMAFGGINEKENHTAQDMVAAAKEMQQFLAGFNQKKAAVDKPIFEARIGINTGPIIAGVVGEQRFAFDIWGTAVNIAARLEQNCDANQINISGQTYAIVQERFDCRFRGLIPVKNLGDQEMYYVL